MEPNYELMRAVDRRYQQHTGLASRAHYSIFYGPLAKNNLLVLNANPGGTPANYKIVDVMSGHHEYIEGRNSGATTANGAKILQYIAGTADPEAIRGIQVLNRFFRRSAQRPMRRLEMGYMAEARPFLTDLINFIQPEAILFGGDSGVQFFSDAHGGKLTTGSAICGPNGSNDAVYFREYQLGLPFYRTVPAYGIYHPSKLNAVFERRVLPILKERLGPLVTQ